eukprot:CCRYP_018979-RA/>CCRYP_018979-RA protein AED:0.11 eAED:0.11 QI:0/-1/0/1/-1/1/1/0/338
MVFPPSPESPAIRFPRTGNNSISSTPRVGMFVSHDDDDDVSVLTFHTLGTKDTITSSSMDNYHNNDAKNGITNSSSGSGSGGNNNRSMNDDGARSKSIYDTQSREDDDEEEDGIKKALSHISEESRNSSSSSHGNQNYPKNKEGIEEEEEGFDEDDDAYDDESLSLAESVLDNANKVLSSIGSSSYYSGLSTRLKSTKVQDDGYNAPSRPRPSPMKLSGFNVLSEKPPSVNIPRRAANESPRNTRYGNDNVGCTSPRHHQQSSYNDTVNENSNQSNLTVRHNHFYPKASGCLGKGGKLRKIQEETRHLQQLLREKQLETKLARSELDAAIRKASELLN